MSQRNYACGEFVFVTEDITTTKGEVVAMTGGEARIMVYDPSKGDTPYGIRGVDGHVTYVYVGEKSLAKNPAKAHLTPGGHKAFK